MMFHKFVGAPCNSGEELGECHNRDRERHAEEKIEITY
jgi:hypothetical protein